MKTLNNTKLDVLNNSTFLNMINFNEFFNDAYSYKEMLNVFDFNKIDEYKKTTWDLFPEAYFILYNFLAEFEKDLLSLTITTNKKNNMKANKI